MKKTLATLAMGALVSNAAFAEQTLEQRIAALENQLAEQRGSIAVSTESTGSIMNNSLASWAQKTTLGGYGEIHYNAFSDGRDNEVDFHRFVLFVGHHFNERVRFWSELEVEHSSAGEGRNGVVEIEQGYIEIDLAHDIQVRAGMLLFPVGIINETHEPPTFFGVERNVIEKYIIPTTWSEAGVGLTKKTASGWVFDGTVTTALDIASVGIQAGSIRSGRNKVSQAIADSAAVTARVAYVGHPGLRVTGFMQYNNDVLQSTAGSTKGLLFGATAEYQVGGFAVRALYSKWKFSGDLPVALDNDGFKSQSGWYVEPSYTWKLRGDSKVGVFGRYAGLDYYSGGDISDEVTTVGVSYWPTANVVFKADYQQFAVNEQFNLGVGFQF